MKKIIALLCIMSFLLSGCVIHRTSMIQARGEDFQGTFWSYAPIKGKNIIITWVKETFFTDEKDRKMPPLLQMYLTENGGTTLKDKE